MAGDVGEIGRGRVRIEADVGPLRAGLEGAKADVEQFAREAEAGTSGISDSMEGLGRRISGTTRGVRVLAGALTSTLGIVTRLLGVFGLISTAIGLAASAMRSVNAETVRVSEASQKHYRSLEDIAALSETLSDEQRRLNALYEATNKHAADLMETMRGRQHEGTLAKALEELQLVAAETRQKILDQEAAKRRAEQDRYEQELRQAEEDRLARLKQIAEQTLRANLPDRERVIAEYTEMYAELAALAERMGPGFAGALEDARKVLEEAQRLELENIAERERAEAELESKRIEAMQERQRREEEMIRERERRETEAEERAARALERAVTNALDRIQGRVESLNQVSANSLESLRRQVEILADNVGIGGRF